MTRTSVIGYRCEAIFTLKELVRCAILAVSDFSDQIQQEKLGVTMWEVFPLLSNNPIGRTFLFEFFSFLAPKIVVQMFSVLMLIDDYVS